jgi:lipoprotein-anchoring transpeptidase ErfK/SrfK
MRMPLRYLALLLAWSMLGLISVVPSLSLAAPTPTCDTGASAGAATATTVGRPTTKLAWRTRLFEPAEAYGKLSLAGTPRGGFATRPSPSWLLVLAAARDNEGRCWVEVRLPERPNSAAAWIDSGPLLLRPTIWRIDVSLATRTLTLDHTGNAMRRIRVVIGAPTTPTPTGLFSIIGAWPSPPNAFLGSWILALTAHSKVLHQFDGGDGRIGIHGRGGESLLDPLGSASSHGCIRLANTAIDWLVHTIGPTQLTGTPVQIH